MKALTFSSFGSPDVLEYIDLPKPSIKKGEVLLKNEAIGLNYADVYRRKGNYHLKGNPPYLAGYEGGGTVVESKSELYKVGDKLAYADVPFANAEYIVVPETHAIPLPKEIDIQLAASVLLQGLTAHYLSKDSHDVQEGEYVLVHAASGGVGQILTQICKAKGGIVIGLTRSADKLQTIIDCDADHAVQLDENWKAKVMEITNQKGVDVVFDSVGVTLEDSFEVTKECGHVVFYGMSGGDPKPVDPRMLMDTSKTLTGGDLWSYLINQEERLQRSKELFDMISNGSVKIKKPVEFSLSDGKAAHEFLESGKSSSKVLLIPDQE
ncbi:quinone oxidoreductase [Flammeovirga yaeyamensis]|uniref:Quinone oxidoreductase n=1 Tax=Flammeovirga yaeyamensis TaxID=367791 RepID=A0AAX1N3W2_9BACT|nr:quinone oxidoreductase [Flammeovirga yaeyamensis]MBB3699717.1 NADPH2:quinone reductase [Flammeovirga yaeyamensis]NMF36713.1 quinone oxidoreductase [Flammeovirga yaeyamensis]QWG02244.1 quinone oxidoreductase [Flammeovirga yaeyamensis]